MTSTAFKAIDDSLGHAGGYAVLREVARRLRSSVRSTDTVARLGGDEFAVLLENLTDESQAKVVAAKIVSAMAELLTAGGGTLTVGISVGVAVHAGPGDASAAELLGRADRALYDAKRAGRGAWRLAA